MGTVTGLTILKTRTLGSVKLDAIISESNTQELKITEFPVQSGAVITDHAIVQPKKYTLKGSVSDVRSLVNSSPTAGFFGNDARATYEELVQLQRLREPFKVVSGLDTFENLLIASLTATQDKDTANILNFEADLQEVIIVETESVTLPARKIAANAKDRGASNTDEGTKQPDRKGSLDDPGNESILASITDDASKFFNGGTG